jgi:hypothetical protein
VSPLIVKGSHADLIREEFKESLRKKAFWAAAARESIPVFGVFLFDWSALHVGIFFALESWLFLTGRVTTGVYFDPEISSDARKKTVLGRIVQLAMLYLFAGAIFGMMVFIPSGFAMSYFIPEERWEDFKVGLFSDVPFAVGLLLLVVGEITASIRVAYGAEGATDEERDAGHRRALLMVHRPVALLIASILLGYLSNFGWGDQLFVLLMFLVLIYFEACPQDVRRTFAAGARSPARRSRQQP